MVNMDSLRGIATVNIWSEDVQKAKEWYSNVLGCEPYFERNGENDKLAYIEFRIGDSETELGIMDKKFAPIKNVKGGAIIYWHVDALDKTIEKFVSENAILIEKPVERGNGFITAILEDPFGNIIGLMYNPHYNEILNSKII
jgi:predicted enzyme related to lactoylglutathione lyase